MSTNLLAILFASGLGLYFIINLAVIILSATGKHPKRKIWRRLYYLGLKIHRKQVEDERRQKLSILTCEVCGRTSEQIYICPSCNRCYDYKCNGGCVFCRKEPEVKHCKCCGHEI